MIQLKLTSQGLEIMRYIPTHESEDQLAAGGNSYVKAFEFSAPAEINERSGNRENVI